MPISMTRVRELLERQVRGELLPDELDLLARSARILVRRLARLSALDPEAAAAVTVHPTLLDLATPVTS
jgi:hypothetical protein